MELAIDYLHQEPGTGLQEISLLLDKFSRHTLNNHSWPEIPTNCTTDFRIAHSGQEIFVQFTVQHDFFQSSIREINTEVHLDNCVEFFLSFDNKQSYYNIEFNCLGTGKMAYGTATGTRTLIDPVQVQKISTWSSLQQENAVFNWQMVWRIPLEVFSFHQLESLEGINADGNFYKCGDALPEPHYLSWNKIVAAAPDFHQPAYFGGLQFLHKQTENGH